MPELDLWSLVAGELAAGNPVALVTLVAKAGSAPGRVGATMALARTGLPVGTVGGGPPESRLIDAARDLLSCQASPALQVLEHRRNAANASGLGCGGSGTYAMWRLQPDAHAAACQVLADLRLGLNRRWRLDASGWGLADLEPAPDGLHLGRQWRYLHTAGPRGQVLLVGGGHVNEALGRLLMACEFGVTVVEARPEVAARYATGAAHRVVCGTGDNIPSVLASHPVQYAVVATHDPDSDRTAMSVLARQPLHYLGLLGSRAKVAAILGRGPFPAHVHAPAGLPIGSQTPEEIAVSIAAELVATRASRPTDPQPEVAS